MQFILLLKSTKNEKNDPFAVSADFHGVTLKVSLCDKSGKPVDINKLPEIINGHYPILFAQNELFSALAEEIFRQQLMWNAVQLKDIKDCNTLEKYLKTKTHQPTCSEAIKHLLHSFDISSLSPDKHAIELKTCIGKLEEMVKDKWDDFKRKAANTSY